jgi:acyl-CoA reductase-like NAD-dependent aldehyde dehydrogenase
MSTSRQPAAGVADGAFYNTGQSCCSVERIYVHESIHDAFVAAFVAEVKGYKMGDPMDESTYIGASPASRSSASSKTRSRTRKRKARSCCWAATSCAAKGNWFEPTVFVDVDHSMALMKDESFGPIIGIQAVADDDAAIDLMNDTEYGLTASVYTTDAKRARRIMDRLTPQRLLELLRSGEPPLAVVGCRPFGDRAHIVDVRHPDVHAAEGVAFAGRLSPRRRMLCLCERGRISR